jgi:intracellular sulfur oxidation DsrE/DsrF family protein
MNPNDMSPNNTNPPQGDASRAALAQLYLDALVDGELAADERVHALARLESDAAFKTDACDLRLLKERVKNAYAEPPAVPVNARRSLRAHGAASRSNQGLLAFAAMLLLAVGLGAGWSMRDFATAPPVFDRIAGWPEGYQPIALTQAIDQNKIILHLDSGETGRLGKVLDLADQVLARQPAARIEIVVNSYGLNLLRADVTPLASRIESMARRHANLSFVACGQTVARLKREGVTVALVPEAHTASSAINQITTRMGQGWVYVKV